MADEVKRYGQWAGNPEGFAENPAYCVKEVWPKSGNGWIPYQCTRKRGHGPDGLYCKQHGKKEVAWQYVNAMVEAKNA